MVLDHQGYKIAIIGLVEKEWFETLNDITLDDIIFEEFVDCANRYVKKFKEDRDDVDFLIALTHMRTPRDMKLAKSCPGLDLVLGGHDHHTVNHEFNGTLVKKSGTDFEEFTLINLAHFEKPLEELPKFENVLTEGESGHDLSSGVVLKNVSHSNYKSLVTEFERVVITSRFPRDPELHEHVLHYTKDLEEKMKVICGYMGVEITGKFTQIRTTETNWSNMAADMINHANKTDCTLFNSGTYRADQNYDPGVFKLGHLFDFLPMEDALIILEVTGEKLHRLLENGVSSYPEFQGKFPSISGIRIKFDPNKPKNSRILKEHIEINGEPINYDKTYTVSTKQWISTGGDGYVDYIGCKVLTREEEALDFKSMFIGNLKLLEERPDTEEYRTILKIVGNEEEELSPEIEKDGKMVKFAMLKPKLDGRLTMINS